MENKYPCVSENLTCMDLDNVTRFIIICHLRTRIVVNLEYNEHKTSALIPTLVRNIDTIIFESYMELKGQSWLHSLHWSYPDVHLLKISSPWYTFRNTWAKSSERRQLKTWSAAVRWLEPLITNVIHEWLNYILLKCKHPFSSIEYMNNLQHELSVESIYMYVLRRKHRFEC